MNKSSLQYSDLSRSTIKQFHGQHGCLMVELNPAQGQLLLSLLEHGDRIEHDLLTDAPPLQLARNYFISVFYEFKARLFSPRLLALQHYAGAVDAAHGWETTQEGKQIFVLIPLNKERPNQAVKRDALNARPLP